MTEADKEGGTFQVVLEATKPGAAGSSVLKVTDGVEHSPEVTTSLSKVPAKVSV